MIRTTNSGLNPVSTIANVDERDRTRGDAPGSDATQITGLDFTIERTRFAHSVAERRHAHDAAHLIIVFAGCWREEGDSCRRTLRYGDVLFHPAGTTHAHVTDAGSDVIVVNLAPRMVNEVCPLYGSWARSIQTSFDALDGVPAKLAAEFDQRDSLRVRLAESLLRLMLILGARAMNRSSEHSPWLARVFSFIDTHLSERITVKDLATLACVSESRFAHLFRAAVGSSPGMYIRSRRVREAARLLRDTDLPVHHVANVTGFYDQAHLCRVFKSSKAMTPVEYRRARNSAPVRDTRPLSRPGSSDDFSVTDTELDPIGNTIKFSG